jgi:DNA-3-methyladenine glycosylase
MEPLPRSFFAIPAEQLAKKLLNKVFVVRGLSGRIVETEAYDGMNDPASHAYRGMTARNEVMFGPAGFLYVYFTYGMHYCANVVAGRTGVASAVLLRALEPLEGAKTMRIRRNGAPDKQLTSGPARLCQALGIDRADNGTDLVDSSDFAICDDGVKPPRPPASGPRVGIRVATEVPWRFWVPGNSNVSRK